jgi:hypothetical protein
LEKKQFQVVPTLAKNKKLPYKVENMTADSITVPQVRLVGDPVLRTPCAPVELPASPETLVAAAQLMERLAIFRAEHGFGRVS